MRLNLVVVAALTAALLLAGCTGNSVTISGQGYKSGTETRTLKCGDDARLALGVQGAGKVTVSVDDGDGDEVYRNGGVAAGQDGDSVALQGNPGTWTLKVSRGIGFAGQYGITLSC